MSDEVVDSFPVRMLPLHGRRIFWLRPVGGRLTQWREYYLHTVGVTGSNPVSPTNWFFYLNPVMPKKQLFIWYCSPTGFLFNCNIAQKTASFLVSLTKSEVIQNH